MLEAAPGQSTTASTAATTQPAMEVTLPMLAIGAGFFLFIGLVLTTAAWALGLFRPRFWPTRVEGDQPVWPLAASLGAGIVLLLMTLVILVRGLGLAPGEAAEAVEGPAATEQTVRAMQASAISYGAAVAGAMVVLSILRGLGFRSRLGLSIGKLPAGLLAGAIAMFLVLPWMWTSGAFLQMVRQALGYPIDTIHSILQAILDDPDPRTIAWGLISALVIAPVAEEILFRGLLQTSLVHGLSRLFRSPVAAEPVSPADTPPVEAVPRMYRWVGIVLASLAFALLHEPWSVPLIFILALMLGYLYERTGNLWAPIVVHFGFNAVNVLFVLIQI